MWHVLLRFQQHTSKCLFDLKLFLTKNTYANHLNLLYGGGSTLSLWLKGKLLNFLFVTILMYYLS